MNFLPRLLCAFWIFSINIVCGQAYIANTFSDSLSAIDVASNNVSATLSVGDAPSAIAITPDGVKAFVVNRSSNNVSIIDVASNNVIANLSVGLLPFAVAITPDGTKVFVANRNDDSVSIIDVASNNVIATLGAGIDPLGIAITPDGTKALVVNESSSNVSIIDVANNNVVTTINVGTGPIAIAITPDGTKAFVVNLADSISIVDLASNSVLTIAIPGIGNMPVAIAITPDGTKAFIANSGNGSVSVIDVASNSIITNINLGGFGFGPLAIAITPDGTKAFVANRFDSSISVIDVASNSVITTIDVGSNPLSIAITPDGAKAFVANLISNNASIIDVASNSLIINQDIENGPVAVAIKPDQAPIALFTASIAPAGFSSTFNAIASFSPIGSIINYLWDFGDGNILSDSQPLASHAYAMPGNYIVTLTVTNSAGTSIKQIFNPSSSFTNFGTTYIAITHNGGPSARATQVIDIPSNSPIITGISPTFGPTSGGTSVTITGFNFTDAKTVLFGTTAASSFVVNSDTQITAFSPSHVAGVVDITVQTASGISPLSSADQFTYQLVSTTLLLTVSPNPAKIGQSVSLTATVSPSVTGSVIFYSNNKLLGVSRVVNGQAVLITSFSRRGEQLIIAAYSGDNQFFGSVSNVVPLHVGKSHLPPPRKLEGYRKEDCFHVVNILKWEAPKPHSAIVAYYIYRQDLNHQIGTVTNLQHLRFKDKHIKACKAYTYFVISIDQAGNASAPAKVVIKGR